MTRLIILLSLWVLANATAVADLSFAFNSPTDVAVSAPGYTASGALNLTLNFPPTPGRNLTVVNNTGPAFISGTFDSIPQGAAVPLTFNGVTYRYIANYYGGNGRSLVLQWPAMGLAGWGRNYSGNLGNIGDFTQIPPVEIPLAGPLAGKTVTDISTKGGHVLALTTDGKVFAWGSNGSGQLGNNSTNASNLPVAVDTSGVLAGKIVVAIAAGASHSLAITSEGRIVTWGNRRAGYAITVNSLTPVEFSPGGLLHDKTVVAVSAGGTFDLALTSEGEIYGWGENGTSQLGGSNTFYQTDPVRVDPGEIGIRTVVAIAAGDSHSLALTQDGKVFSWGSASEGALGINSDPTAVSAVFPTAVHTNGVLAGKFITAIAATDSRSMVVSADGGLFGWGRNWEGELGNGTTAQSNVPVAVITSGALAGKAVASISLGSSHTMAVTTDGAIFAWGDNGNGELGDGGWTDSSVPVAAITTGILKDRKSTRVAASSDTSITLVGLGAPTITRNPLDLMAAAGQTATFTAAAADPFYFSVKWQVSPTGVAGPFSDLAGNVATLTVPDITAAQDGWAYRAIFISDAGQNTTAPAVLRVVQWLATLSSASAIPFQALRVHVSGTLDLQLGFAPAPGTNFTLVQNTGSEFIGGSFDNILQGGRITLSYNGVNYDFIANYHGGNGRSLVLQCPWMKMAAWGSNGSGQFGNGGNTSSSTPVFSDTRVALGGKALLGIPSASTHSIAIAADGRVFDWGYNAFGELGNNSSSNSLTPVAADASGVLAGQTLISAVAGDSHSLAVGSDGRLFSWGSNYSGKLGNNSSTNSLIPVEVVANGALAGKVVVEVAAGYSHSLALTSGGEVFSWGSNSDYQLGNGGWQSSPVPVAVVTRGALLGKTVVAISAGDGHSMALTTDGQVFTWGSNSAGQLGNNGTAQSNAPVKVDTTGVLAGKQVVAISAGERHCMALTSDGMVVAWGRNFNGQLGDNTTTDRSVPVAVSTVGPLSGKTVVSIASGANHCLALTSDGLVFAWGSSGSGQLGTGDFSSKLVPAAVNASGVLAGRKVTAISAGYSYSLATFGSEGSPLVTGNPTDRTVILGPSASGNSVRLSATAIDTLPFTIQWQESPAGVAGTFTNIVNNASATTGTLELPAASPALDGHSYRATFSNNGGTGISTPATLKVLSVVRPLVFAARTDVPITAASPDVSGTLDITLGFAPVPGVDLTVIRNSGSTVISGSFSNLVQGAEIQLGFDGVSHAFVVDYFGGNSRSMVLHWAKTLPAAWGAGSTGQLGAGNNTSTNRTSVAVDTTGVLAGQTLVKLAAGTSHTLALAASGRIFAWGANGSGRLGNGSTAASNVPVEVDATGELAGKQVIAIAAGDSHSLALTSDGQIAAWGLNSNYALGNGGTASSSTPVAVSRTGVLAGKTVTAIAAGVYHNVALLSDGTLATWGANIDGQLGNGTNANAPVPVAVTTVGALAGKTVVAIAAGARHTLALTADGRVFSWGSDQYGQLGTGSSFQFTSNIPIAISGGGLIAGKTVVAIAAGGGHSLAVTSDGKVYAWGLGNQGQLGNGTTSNSSSPVAVTSTGVITGKSVVSIVAGGSHSLAITSDGLGFAWGSNSSGQLGNNSASNASSPVAMSTLGAIGSRPFIAIAAGGTHSIAIAGKGIAPNVTQSPASLAVAVGSTVTFTAAAGGYPAPLVRWQRSITGAGGSFVNLTGQTTLTLELTNVTTSQTGYAYRAVFTNLEASTNSAPATLTVQQTLGNYLVSRGLAANSAPLDDPNQTGINNLLAYAFNLIPSTPDRSQLPIAASVGGHLQISYTRWKNASDLRATAEVSNGLGNWLSGPGITEVVSVTSIDLARETVVEQEILADPTPARFIRVRVEILPP